MRVALICEFTVPGSIGGIQDQTADLAYGLVAEGCEVVVFTTEISGNILEEERFRGIEVIIVSRAFWYSPLGAQGLAETFYRVHEENNFDIVHSQGPSALALMRTGVQERVPLAVSWHGHAWIETVTFVRLAKVFSRNLRTLNLIFPIAKRVCFFLFDYLRREECRIYRGYDSIVGCDAWLASTRRLFRIPRDKLHTVRNGVWASSVNNKNPRWGITIAGCLEHEKGHIVALEALVRLQRSGVDIPVVRIAGDGSALDCLQSEARRLRVDSKIHWLGRLTSQQVDALYASSQLLLAPSLLEESIPLVVLRALHYGCDVIASRVGGLPELARHSERLFLVPPGKPAALASEISHWIRTEKFSRAQSRNVEAKVAELFSGERMTSEILMVYRYARSDWEVK